MSKCQVVHEIVSWILCEPLAEIADIRGDRIMGKVTPERIKYFRKRLGLKQEELAELCGVDASCISRWEIGKWSPSVESSLRLAKALKVTVEDLCEEGETKMEDIATKQAVAEFQELNPQEQGLVLTLIRELKKLRDGN